MQIHPDNLIFYLFVKRSKFGDKLLFLLGCFLAEPFFYHIAFNHFPYFANCLNPLLIVDEKHLNLPLNLSDVFLVPCQLYLHIEYILSVSEERQHYFLCFLLLPVPHPQNHE